MHSARTAAPREDCVTVEHVTIFTITPGETEIAFVTAGAGRCLCSRVDRRERQKQPRATQRGGAAPAAALLSVL